ncbi:DUF4091 domain-containing protein [Parapedobacter lycopersici]|uniref:DUF4091 domain-containing protein n=1 Tax=Parapedobacter lycopersici TaxID=1864939 RepID=UPI00214D4CA7|nr:DUF4091 domain-containing protein [Parapedobacter lycopersici]
MWACGRQPSGQRGVTYTEPVDPYPVADSVWLDVPYGLHGMFVSPDVHFLRSAPPQENQVFGNWQAKAWRGERIHTQALIWSAAQLEDVRLRVTDLSGDGDSRINAEQIQANFVRYVITDDLDTLKSGCGIPSGLDTFLVADVIDHVTNLTVGAKTARPVWLQVDVPADAEPGRYEGTLHITAEGQEAIALPYTVEVLPHVLPPAAEWDFHLDLWQNPFSVARYYDLEPWSAQHLEAMRPYMQLLADAGQKAITVSMIHDPWNGQTYDVYQSMIKWVRKKDGTWQYDYTNFDKWVTYMMDFGIDKFINCYSMIPWNQRFYYYDEALGKDTLLVASPESAAYRNHWQPMLADFARHLKARGWWELTTIAMDERPMEDMLEAIAVIKEADPDFRVSLAGAFHPELADVLLDYCIASGEQMDEATIRHRREQGYTTTFYTCCAEPRPNTFTQSPYAEATWLPWHALHKGYDGYLRWAYNCWNENPLEDSRYGTWAAGDAWLVYPGARSSIRFERLREGIQDVEKVRLIRSKLQQEKNKDALSSLEDAIAFFELDTLDTVTAAEAVNRAKAILNSF